MTDTTQTTDTASTDNTPPPQLPAPSSHQDIVRRAVARRLPCKLTDEEMLRIARTRVGKEAERDQLVADAKLDADKRKEQIKEYDDEILVMRRELHTGSQDRTIKTNEVFEPDGKGGGFVVVYRLDTNAPTGERWPASPSELQRYLPSADGTGSILDQAAAVQKKAKRSAQDADAAAPTEDGVPDGLPAEDDDAADAEADADGDDAKTNSKGRNGKKGK